MLRRRILLQSTHGAAEFVDLGLPSGLLWATGNIIKDAQGNYSIGAESDYGCYFSWGNIDGHNEDEGYNFSSSNYRNSPGASLTADISSSDALHDAALARLGTPCHLPTPTDYRELFNNTDIEWVADYNGTGVAGKKFMKKTDHSVFVFFPASGRINGTTMSSKNEIGYYWNNYYFTDNGGDFEFSNSVHAVNQGVKRRGLPIRAVK